MYPHVYVHLWSVIRYDSMVLWVVHLSIDQSSVVTTLRRTFVMATAAGLNWWGCRGGMWTTQCNPPNCVFLLLSDYLLWDVVPSQSLALVLGTLFLPTSLQHLLYSLIIVLRMHCTLLYCFFLLYIMFFVHYRLFTKVATMGDQHWWVSTFLATRLCHCAIVLQLCVVVMSK